MGSLEGTLQYYHHATPEEPGLSWGSPLHGNGTEGFLLKNLYCLEGLISN